MYYKLQKIAFLDRDGVINVNLGKGDYVTKWEEFKFLPGAISGIKLLNAAGYKVIVVTNQRGISQKIMTEKDLQKIHQMMVAYIRFSGGEIDQVYYCPHDRDVCVCRKPGIGMFLQAEMLYVIDKKNSLMIGDSRSDIEAGENYGIHSYLLEPQDTLENLVKRILCLSRD